MKLLLVDGSALLHRAYHAYPPLTSKTGQVVGAVYGVASMLYSTLAEVQPTHVMVAWDLPKPTFRHEKYVGYKAQRPKADVEMVEQIPVVKEVIAAMGVVQIEQEGYEADDIIGTIATQMSQKHQAQNPNNQTNYNIQIQKESEEKEIIILTGDQDTMQLVNEQVSVLTPPKGKLPAKRYGVDEVREKYGVWPSQIVDYKALIGDASDNIPGVAGIGPKTAAQLLKMFESLERIYRDIKEVQLHFGEKVAFRLMDGKESAFLSQELSRIVTEMPLAIILEEMEYAEIKSDKLKDTLEELGFKSLMRRIWGDPTPPKDSEGAGKLNSNQMGLF
jgi:DNA polymerase-1